MLPGSQLSQPIQMFNISDRINPNVQLYTSALAATDVTQQHPKWRVMADFCRAKIEAAVALHQ